MVKSSDLRKWNWVDVPHTKFGEPPGYTQVETIGYNGINIYASHDSTCECFHIEESIFGIELTPEILEKCDFSSTSKGFWQHSNWYNISLKKRNGTYDLRCNFIERIATNIYHIHQLQNLYHSLTGGQELQIKDLNLAVKEKTDQ